jgi:hypothetical protein
VGRTRLACSTSPPNAQVLRAEPRKSLASFTRVLPAIAARTQANPPGEHPAPEEQPAN